MKSNYGFTFPQGLNRRYVLIPVIIASLCFFPAGCKKDFDPDKVKALTWTPDIAIAVVDDSITLKKILTRGNTEDHLYIDENGDISILYYYNKDAFRIRPADLIRLQQADAIVKHTVTQAEQEILAVTDLTLTPVGTDIQLVANNAATRIDKLLVRSGTVTVSTNHTFSNSGHLTINLLNASRNGLPVSIVIEPYKAGPTVTTIDISNVDFNLYASPNVIRTEIGGLLKKSARPVAGDEIRTTFTVRIDTIGEFEGFLGYQTMEHMADTVSVDVFNNAYALGNVYFSDPQVSITIVNSIGIPAEVTVNKLVAINNASSMTYDIAGYLGAGAVIQVPSPLPPLQHPTVKTMNYSNASTGNAMADFFNVKPDNVAFQVTTVVNPTGIQPNFFNDTSSFFADLRVKLPMFGYFDHLTYQDTFDLDIARPEEIEYLEFRTKIVNGMPMTGEMQVYFTDAEYNLKDSLAGNDLILIREAPVDPATYLPYPGQYGVKDTTYILDKQRMQNFEQVKKMLVKAVLGSAENGQQEVKLRASQAIKLNFSARAKLRTTIQPKK